MQHNNGPTQPSPDAMAIPEIKAGSGKVGASEHAELNQFAKDSIQTHGIRRYAAYGGLVFVGVLYIAGLFAVARFLGVYPAACMVGQEVWHIVAAVLFVLFSVPTVLLIAILKSTSPSAQSSLPPTAHEAIGRMIERLIEKLTE